jgi:hypothetical protein
MESGGNFKHGEGLVGLGLRHQKEIEELSKAIEKPKPVNPITGYFGMAGAADIQHPVVRMPHIPRQPAVHVPIVKAVSQAASEQKERDLLAIETIKNANKKTWKSITLGFVLGVISVVGTLVGIWQALSKP